MIGCGGAGGPSLAEVSGTVTLDGMPLPAVRVEFNPTEPNGSPSLGRTDAQGKYTLQYNRDKTGAMIGTHRVRVMSADELESPAETVPAIYNSETTLTQEVQAGTNTIDLALTTPPGGGRPRR